MKAHVHEVSEIIMSDLDSFIVTVVALVVFQEYMMMTQRLLH